MSHQSVHNQFSSIDGTTECLQAHQNYDCIHRLFEQEASRSPKRVAIDCGPLSLTYEDLNRRANQLAHYLKRLGIGREILVGLSMERSPDLIVCILGVLKAGGAYLPLDPRDPQERLAMIIEDAKPAIVLTNSDLLKRNPVDRSRLVCVDDLDLEKESTDNLEISISSANLAYVMFTSGSTGSPKGVMIEHRSVVRLVKNTDYADFSADNVFLQFAPITFDASTFEIWGALLNGARLAIMPAGMASLSDLGRVIHEHGVTTLWLTAGLFHLMVDERIDDLRPLRQLLAGGDILSVNHVGKVLSNLDCDLINGYGPTENTTFTCTYKIPRNTELGRSIPIGKPITNSQVLILDKDRRPVIDGESGELWIGGDGLARGYFNSDEMTAERFFENPFSSIPSSRLYRSGDLARVRPDGNIEFLGRADEQVKIRGFRIELGEIEDSLTRQIGVREAVAIARKVPNAEKQLIAFVVFDPATEIDVPTIRKRLEETLPEYMVPTFIVELETFPLTPNGKVDRGALVNKIGSGTQGTSTLESPTGECAQTIALLLESVLGSGRVGENDNFFDLGADSLQMAQFHHRLQEALDSDLKIISLFQNPTVNSLARLISNSESSVSRIAELTDRAKRQRNAFTRRREILRGGN